MTPVSYSSGVYTSKRWAEWFAQGCGGDVATLPCALRPGPVAVFPTPPLYPLLADAYKDGRTVYYGDNAYLGRKGTRYRITRDGLQHSGSGDVSPRAWSQIAEPIQPWRKRGHHVLVCPNSEPYYLHPAFPNGPTRDEWVSQVTADLKTYTDRPIVVRDKKEESRGHPIASALANAWACVVYTSGAALKALLAGVPVFVLSPHAASARMGLSDLSQIETPYYPNDRLRFFEVLAANQWSQSEIANGTAWRALDDAS